MINKIEVGIMSDLYPASFFWWRHTAYVKNMHVNNI